MVTIAPITSPTILINASDRYLNKTTIKFGYIEDDPKSSDLLFKDNDFLSAAPLVGEVSLKQFFKEVSQQYSLSACHDDKTEVLTNTGWKFFKDITENDKLGSINPENSEIIYVLPNKIIKYKYNGYMVYGKNQHTLDFMVTPNHNMLVRKWNDKTRKLDKNYNLVEAKDLGWYCGLMNRVKWNGNENKAEYYTLKGVVHKHTKQRVDISVPMSSWLKFLGIYIAEGTIIKPETYKVKATYRIQLAAAKKREKDFIKEILYELGINATEYKDRFVINNKRLYMALCDLGLKGVKSFDKFVPKFVFDQTSENIENFLLGHFMGDGTKQKDNKSHFTSSEKLANDLQLLIFLSGNESYLVAREKQNSTLKDGRKIIAKHTPYRVSVCRRKTLSIYRESNICAEYYSGNVFCAEVEPYHTLVTRRNGKILISGNCVGNAVADAFEAKIAIKHNINPAQVKNLSRLFIYWNARNLQYPPSYTDTGTRIRLAFDSVCRYGVPYEDGDIASGYWPYDSAKVNVRPSILSYREAIKNRIAGFYRIDATGDDRLVQVIKALSSGHPVVFGTKLANSYRYVNSEAIVEPPTGSYIGGHAQIITGWSESRKGFEVRNSWGTNWGVNGYCYMSPNYIKADITRDLWVPTL